MTAAERTDEIPIPPGLRLAPPSEEETLDEEMCMSDVSTLIAKVDGLKEDVGRLRTELAAVVTLREQVAEMRGRLSIVFWLMGAVVTAVLTLAVAVVTGSGGG